jgi:cobalamin synthase
MGLLPDRRFWKARPAAEQNRWLLRAVAGAVLGGPLVVLVVPPFPLRTLLAGAVAALAFLTLLRLGEHRIRGRAGGQ